MKNCPVDGGTLVPDKNTSYSGTMIAHTDCGTLVPDATSDTSELESDLGTMVINSDPDDSTMKDNDSNAERPKYRPQFMDFMDRLDIKKTEAVNKLSSENAKEYHNISEDSSPEEQSNERSGNQFINDKNNQEILPSAPQLNAITGGQIDDRYQSQLQMQLNQISAANQMGLQHGPPVKILNDNALMRHRSREQFKYQRNFLDGDFEQVQI